MLHKRILRYHVNRLPKDEFEIVNQYLTKGTELEHLPLTPPVVRLEQKKIITRSFGFRGITFSLSDNVREIIWGK
jgi:hypothetical protein